MPDDQNIFVPGRDPAMKMSIAAFRKLAQFVLDTPFKANDYFTIEGTDKKKLVILLEA
jgi:hypothetical protein